MFRFIAVGGEDFVAASGGDHEGFVATGLNTVVDRNVPLIKRWADGLDFALMAASMGERSPNSLRRGRRSGRRAAGIRSLSLVNVYICK